jgi:nucleoside-diphosphate-sugar epimerase
MRVLVTGSEGYIGTVVAARLAARGFDVAGVDARFYAGGELFAPPAGPPGRHADTRRLRREDLAGFDAVVHLAELSNDPLGELSPLLTEEINVKATVRLAALARDAGVGRWIQFSSCSVYGSGDGGVLDESSPARPLTAYAAAKARSEEGLRALAAPGFAPVLLRLATVYGVSPRIRLDLVANQFAAMALIRGRLDLQSDGTPVRPLVHIEDVCEAAGLALDAPAAEVSGETFNIGADEANYTVGESAESTRRLAPGCVIRFGQAGADRRSYRVSFAKVRDRLGFRPRRTLDEGLAEVMAALREAGSDETALTGSKYFRLARIKERLVGGELDQMLFERGGTHGDGDAAAR